MTLWATINRDGGAGPPRIVLPGLKKLPPELERMQAQGKANFSCAQKGWATGRVFVEDARKWCDWLEQKHRPNLPPRERSKAVVLFVDGSSTHIELDALLCYRDHGVIVISLVPHCSHILQPIDVNWARRFKVAFTRNFVYFPRPGEIERHTGINPFRSAAARARMVIVSSATSAYQETCNERTCAKAWDLAGLSQVHWDCGASLIADSKYVSDRDGAHDPQMELEAAHPTRFWTSARILTSDEFLQVLAARQTPRPNVPPLAPADFGLTPEQERVDDEGGDVDLELSDEEFWRLAAEFERDELTDSEDGGG
jgi:hypothetical protein